MATPTEESRREVIRAREQLGDGLDDLSSALRSAVDIPAKIRKNPLQTAALAGGVGFLAVGGPKRVIKGALGRIRPSIRRPHEGLLPKEIDRVVKRNAGARSPEVETALENDFANYLKAKGKAEEAAPNASRSLWKTYDTVVGPLGALVAKQLVDRLAAADPNRPRDFGPKVDPVTGAAPTEPKAAPDTPKAAPDTRKTAPAAPTGAADANVGGGVRGAPGSGSVLGNKG